MNSPGAVHASGLIDVHHHIGSQGVTKRYPDIGFILAHAGAVPYLAGRVGIAAAMLADLGGAAPVVAEGIGKVFSVSRRLQVRMPGRLSYYLRFKQNVLPEGPDYFLGRFYYGTALSASPHCFSSLLTITDCSHPRPFSSSPLLCCRFRRMGTGPAKIESIAIE